MTGHVAKRVEIVSGHADADEPAVSGHALPTEDRAGQRAADRRRAAKLRQRREQAGEVRIQAWVPRERAAYARQVLQAVVAGANALPPDPVQQADLDAARAEATTAWAELGEARAVGDRHAVQAQSAEAAALARAEAAEQGWEKTTRELAATRAEAQVLQGREQAAREAAAKLLGELEGIRGRGGWRGMLMRLASTRPRPDRS